MTINLDTEIVATAHDPATGMLSYTIEREGKRWTVHISEDEFASVQPIQEIRRNFLAGKLNEAMQGPPDA